MGGLGDGVGLRKWFQLLLLGAKVSRVIALVVFLVTLSIVLACSDEGSSTNLSQTATPIAIATVQATPQPTAPISTPPTTPTRPPNATLTAGATATAMPISVEPPDPMARLSLRLDGGQSTNAAASAFWEVEDHTEVVRYEVAVGSAMGRSDVMHWHDVGLTTTYHARDGQDGASFALQPNRDYYLTVRAMGADGTVLGAARSGAWYVYEPYDFNADRYSSVILYAPGSFWHIRFPGVYDEHDEAYGAYVVGSGAIDLYHRLDERVLIGSPQVSILQTEGSFPTRIDIIRIGPENPDEEDGKKHADEIASMLYDCDAGQGGLRPFNYYKGCQTSPRKYAMTSDELRRRLKEFVLTPETASSFESEIFAEMGAPQVWAMPHAHPTDVYFGEDQADHLARGLRLGDWIFSEHNILAMSPQPGPWAGHENPSLSGNYYNSLVVGEKSYLYSYAAQSSIDNMGGSRHKPDIVVAASNRSEASSWSVATMAAAASAMLGLSYAEPLLAGSAYVEVMKAIILAGAGKDFLCPESINESMGWCNALPSASEQWQWSNTETAPLDPTYGAGLFNYRNSFDILTAGRSVGGIGSGEIGWDTRLLAEGQSATYTFTPAAAHDSFSLALNWHRKVTIDSDGTLVADLPDYQVELLDRDGTMLVRSDDPYNNIEHIYLPEGLELGRQYTIKVTLKSAENPTRYGLAWQTRIDAIQNSPWRELEG